MRFWLFTLLLLLLRSPLAYSQQQYTEAACILLQQQIERFSPQPQLSTYQDSKRQFDKHCQKPIPAPDKPLVLTNIPAKSAMPPANTAAESVAAPANPSAQVQKFDIGAMMLSLFTPYIPYIIGTLLLLVLPGLLIALVFGNKARFLGAMAERQLHRLLVRNLPVAYQHYRNLILETAKGDLTEIDHLVLSPFGIFVIEVKNYKGWIFGSEHQPQWTVQHFRSKGSFQNPLHQNSKHTAAVKFALGISLHDSKQVHSIVAFSDRAELRTSLPAQVCYIRQVAAYIQQFTQPCFSDEQLRQFTARLNIMASKQRNLRKVHLKQVKSRQ
ncbi:Nuclease-related domain-containing protein [Arsukibacterium tuosuense]|uniref:Nuclease-related domain-containing protein n=1 Tax=Arsukibacterium tuosuense TaxID=1323745 RepID=A0A285IQ44_9GAMM|nr:nuclease-related domain-containing protein [Arsukibacterium tuosuense]SNY50092.1 Nuclease-related domain-containing protein [Arsukibacterium tuosuense]